MEAPSSVKKPSTARQKIFSKSPILHIQIWNSRIDTAVAYGENNTEAQDIRGFGIVQNIQQTYRRPRIRRRNSEINRDVPDRRLTVQRSLNEYLQDA